MSLTTGSLFPIFPPAATITIQKGIIDKKTADLEKNKLITIGVAAVAIFLVIKLLTKKR